MNYHILNMRHPMAAARMIRKERYAWPGGYEMALVTSDGALLCYDCVGSNFAEISAAFRSRNRTGGWYPAGWTHTGEMEESEQCAHCNKAIHNPED